MKQKIKYSHVATEGKYIGERQHYNYFINLYILDDTFYEVWYFKEGNEIEKVEKLDEEKKVRFVY